MTAPPPAGPPADDAYPPSTGQPAAGVPGVGYPPGFGDPETVPSFPAAVPGAPGPAGLVPGMTVPAGTRRSRRGWRMAIAAVAGAACLVTAIVAGLATRAELTRPPTSAELAAAAHAAVAVRWRTWPAGRIFPASLAYTTDLLSQEQAERVGIAPGDSCAAALTGAAVAAARKDDCLAAIRATYTDPLQGIVYTTGVLAFPTQAAAGAFAQAAAGDPLPSGLRAFALRATGSALFTDTARQAAADQQGGPYVVLAVAGYADGRPAGIGQRRSSVFAPAGQLAEDLVRPLAALPVVRCGKPGWSC